MNVNYSVVIPIKDEESNIPIVIEELEAVMQKLDCGWELICVDDGSTDSSLSILKGYAEEKSYLRVLSFVGNFGQSSAFDAGFKAAKGEWVITLDGDGQNDPADIPTLIKECRGYDLVCGWRVNRKDPLSKKVISKLANFVRGRVCQDYVHDTGCSLKLYKKVCLQNIKLFNGMHRFLPALFVMEGFRVKEVPVNHRERAKGVSKYNFFNRSLAPVTDLFALIWMRRRYLKYKINKEIS